MTGPRIHTETDAESEAQTWAAQCRRCPADVHVSAVDVERRVVTFACPQCDAAREVSYEADVERGADDDD